MKTKRAIEYLLEYSKWEEEVAVQCTCPKDAYEQLEELGWEYGGSDGGDIGDWVYEHFYHSLYSNVGLAMGWNGWTNSVVIYLYEMEGEED